MTQPYVVCRVDQTHYAIPAADVQQLEMVEQITRVPGSTEALDGVVYLRGQVVPVLNLRSRLGLPRVDYDYSSRLVIVRLDRRVVALAVDSASEFASFSEEACQPAPEALARLDYLAGVVAQENRLILILNVRRLLESDNFPQGDA
ncbi:purine-binding chemotaxis protein CheW [bacterium]|nr:purine-binding chemotaxis protein CheW [bacterium]